MNKAFVREPEFDGRAYCPQCGSLGVAVHQATLDHHLNPESRSQLGKDGWFCPFPQCNLAYFDLFERSATVDELKAAVYPKDPEAPICACFGFTVGEITADVEDGTPTRIRELLAKSESPDAQCHKLAADGRCCIREVQRVYLKERWQ